MEVSFFVDFDGPCNSYFHVMYKNIIQQFSGWQSCSKRCSKAAAISVAQGRESWQNNRSTEAPSL